MNVHYVSGRWEKDYTFASAQEYNNWVSATRIIEDHISAINADGNPGSPRVARYREWLESVRRFIRTHGEAMVPPDMQWAVNDVEGGVGVPLTVWQDPPENHLRVVDPPANPPADPTANPPAGPPANPPANPPVNPPGESTSEGKN